MLFVAGTTRCRLPVLFWPPVTPLSMSRLTWIQRITLVLFLLVVTNWVMNATIGYSLLGADLFTLFFIIFLCLSLITAIRPLMQRLLWRVRHRLLVTYFLAGVLPLILILAIFGLGFYMFVAATSNYLSQSALNDRLDLLQTTAKLTARNLVNARGNVSSGAPDQMILRIGNRIFSKDGPVQDIPAWSKPGFKGVIRRDTSEYLMAAHEEAGTGAQRVEVFAYAPFDNEVLAKFLPNVASIQILRLPISANEDADIDFENVHPRLDSSTVSWPPAARGFWDITPRAGWPLTVLDWNSGAKDDHIVGLTVRPSALLRQLLSPLGALARPIVISFFVIAAVLFAVELMAGISSLQLARTVTRSVHDLYVGTRKVEAGDFSHRIPVRSKDQLSELANAFNSMTGRVERLIAEVKEKEKLQAELEIARQVQAQLFPKRIPALRTLELLGFCKPARVVSGDYYDFIPFDSRSTALVIGDISGKGISAALLMASVQSSLHAQLKMRSNGFVSTATLVARLNQQLYESTPPEKYATVYCSFYDDESGRLSYTNAGHLAPMVVRRGNIVRLESNGMAVGLFPNLSYEENVIALEPGDLLTAFTDGITESENAAGEQFGEMRLADLLVRHCHRPLDEIVRLITEDVRNWVHDVDNQDDTTMLLARRV